MCQSQTIPKSQCALRARSACQDPLDRLAQPGPYYYPGVTARMLVPDERTIYSSHRRDGIDALAWPVFSEHVLDMLRSAGEVLHPEAGEGGLVLAGDDDRDLHRLRDFAERNQIPYRTVLRASLSSRTSPSAARRAARRASRTTSASLGGCPVSSWRGRRSCRPSSSEPGWPPPVRSQLWPATPAVASGSGSTTNSMSSPHP